MAKTPSRGRVLQLQAGICLLILLLVPMQTMAEESVLPVLDCSDQTLHQAESMECSIDLSDYVGTSTIRYEFIPADSSTAGTHTSVLATGVGIVVQFLIMAQQCVGGTTTMDSWAMVAIQRT